MINWKKLEKFIAPGGVVTLVVLVDGEEIGAFSFNVDSLAFKEVLEAVKAEPVKVADKPKPAPVKKAETFKSQPKPEPEPMDEEEPEEEENNDIDKVFVPESKPMTREQIMMQSETAAQQEPQGPAKEPEQIKAPDKPAQQQMQLTDEW
jgi:ribosomal protein L12E/L44/L45/RPP1/RPP2